MGTRILTILVAMMVSFVVLAGCGGSSMGTSAPPPHSGTSMYSAYAPGAEWTYKGSAAGSPDWTYSRRAVGMETYSGKSCLKMDEDGDHHYLMEMSPDAGMVMYAELYEGMTEPYTPPLQMGPDKTLADYTDTCTHWGNTMTVHGHVVSPSETMTVPYGTFTAVHVKNTVTTGSNTHDEDSWWAQGVGMVKKVTTTDGMQSTLALTSFTPAP